MLTPQRTKEAGPLACSKRAKTLIAAALLALGLAFGLYATSTAQPAQAYEKGVCGHSVSTHYGPEGRFHKTVFVSHWTNNRGQHIHRMAHYTKYSGKYFLDWKRNFWCDRYVNA